MPAPIAEQPDPAQPEATAEATAGSTAEATAGAPAGSTAGSGRHRLRRLAWTVAAGLIAVGTAFALLLMLTPSAGDAAARADALVTAHPEASPVAHLPARVVDAVLATEDHRFYQHPGLDPIALGRVGAGLLRGDDNGGATIETQLAKLLYSAGRQDWRSQLVQVGVAVKLDRSYTKTQILLMYLNTAYFGHGFYGVTAAARGYFGREPDQLDWAQAALLGGLLQAPSAYDPYEHPRPALARRHHVLERLQAVGALTTAQAASYDRAGLGLRA